ncbi:MAG: hypothetical protein ABJA74_15900 [Lapillicoccus sp.]
MADGVQTADGSAGRFVLRLRHGFRVGRMPSRKLNLYTPAAMLGYFDEMSAASNGGDADATRYDEIARRQGMEVIGPVPDGDL